MTANDSKENNSCGPARGGIYILNLARLVGADLNILGLDMINFPNRTQLDPIFDGVFDRFEQFYGEQALHIFLGVKWLGIGSRLFEFAQTHCSFRKERR